MNKIGLFFFVVLVAYSTSVLCVGINTNDMALALLGAFFLIFTGIL
jgi:hypothetical protein